MLEIAALTVMVLLAWGAVTVAFVAVKAVLWLLLLPIRFLLAILLLPLKVVTGLVGWLLPGSRVSRAAVSPTTA
jgi:hypothetical protein